MTKANKLREAGHEVARGTLHLDKDAAERKIGSFSLPDPHFWVLQIVRVAAVLGARSINFEVSTTRVFATFEGRLDRDLLLNMWSTALDRRDTPQRQAIHYLARACSAAKAFNPSAITIVTDGGTLVLADGEEHFQPGPARPTTEIEMRESMRLGHVLEFFDELLGEPTEVHALKTFASYGPLAVRANGARLTPHDLWSLSPNTRGKFRGDESLDVFVLRHGVRIHHSARGLWPMGGTLIHDDETLPLDISTMSPSASPAPLIPKLHDEYLGIVTRQNYLDFDFVHSDLLDHVARIGKELPTLEGSNAERLVQGLAVRPMFNRATGADRGLYSLESGMRNGAIEFTIARMPELTSPPHQHVLFMHKELCTRLEAVGLRTRDVTTELERIRYREGNRKRWERQPKRIAPDATTVIRSGEFQAWVELTAVSEGAVEFCIEQSTVRIDSLQIPCRIVVDGPFETTDGFDDVIVPPSLGSLVEPILQRLNEAWEEVPSPQTELFAEQVIVGRLVKTVYRALRQPQPDVELPHSIDGWLKALGNLADRPVVELEGRNAVTLREVLLAEPPPVFGPTRHLVIPLEPGRLVIEPSSPLARFLPLMRSEIDDAKSVMSREASRRRFSAMEQYEPPDRDYWHSIELEQDDVRLLAQLREGGPRPTSDVRLVYEGRSIARQIWEPLAGQWDVAVWSDGFQPKDHYKGVLSNDALQLAMRLFRDATQAGLRDWHAECVASSRVADEALNLLYELPDRLEIEAAWAAWRWDGAHWRKDVLSTADVLAMTDADQLAFTLHDLPPKTFAYGPVVLRLKLAALELANSTFTERRLVALDAAPRTQTKPIKPRPLTAVIGLLHRARAGRRELLGDHFLKPVSIIEGGAGFVADDERLTLGRSHPFAGLAECSDPVVLAFLASNAATAINAYYRAFTDDDEIRLQHALLRRAIPNIAEFSTPEAEANSL